MAKFNGFILTEKGRELLAKGLAGETITFTKMAIGDGTSLTSERERTTLVNQITTLPILNINTKRNGTCEINALLTNKSVTTGFYIKELGIFAHGNDSVEILYAYNISISPDFVPPFSANNVVEIEYVDTIIVDQVANVTAVIDPSITYITKKYADENYLVSSRLAEILGLQFGGNIQDIGNKTKGKFYYDNVTKFYYECIEDNSLTYNDSGKFRAISNKPISDKVENLFKNNKNGYLKLGNILIQWGFVSVPTNQYTLIYPVAYKELPSIVTSNWSSNDTVTHTGRSQSQCLFSSNTSSLGFDWMTVGVV
jgi:hypothetical protein